MFEQMPWKRARRSHLGASARNRRGLPALVAISIAAAGGAFAREAAHMRLPTGFVDVVERISTAGFGGANRGEFSAGDWRGQFVRIESRLAVFDPLYAANRGKSSFTLEGMGIDLPIEGECQFKESVVTAGVITFDAKKLAYVCDIKDSSGVRGDLTLGEPKPESFKQRVLARSERRGLARVGDVHLDIVSVHEFERSKLGSATPLGYLLTLDAEIVAAVELTDANPVFLIRRGLAPEVRRATIVASLGLSVLRDPANSMLAD